MVPIYLLKNQSKYRMRSGRGQVHFVRPDHLVLEPVIEQLQDFTCCVALKSEQVFYGVNIKSVPFEFETCVVEIASSALPMERWLYQLVPFQSFEHPWI